MKKVYLFIAAAMIAVSCSDDDSNSTTRDASIDASMLIGQWDLISLKDNGTNVSINDCDYGTYKEFTAAKTFIEEYQCSSSTYTEESNYTVSGNVISNVVVGDPDSPYIFKVTQLTPDILVYTHDFVDQDNKPHTNTFTFNKL